MRDVMDEEAPAEIRMRPEAVAPWPHTVFLVAVLALWATYGLVRLYLPTAATPRPLAYISSVVVQCLLVGSTIAGLYHRRQFVSDVLGGLSWREIGADVGRGFGVFLVGLAVMLVVVMLLRPFHLPNHRAVLQAVGPHTSAELALWMLLSLCVGICEEFVFRGYLLRQLRGWTRSVGVAVGVSALLFGCMHFYEGSAAVVQITGLGAWYAVAAVRRGNLRSVMVAHFLQDAFAGLVLYLHH
jgi:membrane protease YdiL (CAAX protease family)